MRSRFFPTLIALTLLVSHTAFCADESVPDSRLTIEAFAAMSDAAYEGSSAKDPIGAPEYVHARAVAESYRFYVVDPATIPGNVRAVLNVTDPTKTPYARLFRGRLDGKPAWVVAFRGTYFIVDWAKDILGGTGVIPNYYVKARDFVGALKRGLPPGSRLLLTGHSLGGGMAEYAAAKHGLEAVTFNSAHLSQPFPPDPRALIATYHISGKYGVYLVGGDFVNQLRLGGNFEQTRLKNFHWGNLNPISSHSIRMFAHDLEWMTPQQASERKRQLESDPFANANSWDAMQLEASLPTCSLLEANPNLVCEIPVLLRDAIRRRNVNRSPAFDKAGADVIPDIWDVRFRYGRIRDSHPAGGVPIETLRVLDEAAGSLANTGADSAKVSTWATSYTHVITRPFALQFSWNKRSIRYDLARQRDFSIESLTSGFVYTSSPENSIALAGTWRRFELKTDNIGTMWGVELADSYEPNSDTVLWVNGSINALRETDLARGDGLVLEAQAGMRYELSKLRPLVFQPRAFAGVRKANNDRLNNTQWGLGFGFACNPGNWRLFAEPGVRWTQHVVVGAASAGVADHEFVFRAQAGYQLSRKIGRYEILGWEVAAGYLREKVTSSSAATSYGRELWSLELTKRF